MREGLNDASANAPVYCGRFSSNLFGLKLQVDEGFDPNEVDEFGALCLRYAQSATDVDNLIAVGAKPELLKGKDLPCPRALRRLLQLRPQLIKATFSGEVILANSHKRLRHVEVMREFDCPAPDVSNEKPQHECALFTFQYIHRRPVVNDYACMLWRPHTHYACPRALKRRVMTVLLILNRCRPRLPRDMRNLLLLTAFGQEKFDASKSE